MYIYTHSGPLLGTVMGTRYWAQMYILLGTKNYRGRPPKWVFSTVYSKNICICILFICNNFPRLLSFHTIIMWVAWKNSITIFHAYIKGKKAFLISRICILTALALIHIYGHLYPITWFQPCPPKIPQISIYKYVYIYIWAKIAMSELKYIWAPPGEYNWTNLCSTLMCAVINILLEDMIRNKTC